MRANRWTCPKCTTSVTSIDSIALPVRCACGLADFTTDNITTVEVADRPAITTLGARYASAQARWVAAGCPRRSDQRLLEIIDTHCRGCLQYIDHTCTHALCGCQVKTPNEERESVLGWLFGGAFVNKLRYATEACPAGRFPADA